MDRKLINATLLLLFFSLLVPPQAATAEAATEDDLNAAIDLYHTEGAEIALPGFERLQASFNAQGEEALASRAERYIGESHWRLGDYEPARVHLEAALEAMRRQGLRLNEGKVLNVLGLLEWDLGNYEQAIADFGQASRIGEELGHKPLAGSTMNNLSLVYDELGDYRTSLEQYRQALKLYEGADFPRGVSDTLGNIGGVYLLLGRYTEALDYYQRALAISEELQSRASMSLDHGNLGLCYLELGQVAVALEHFDRAMELANEAGMRKEAALWQSGKGNALIRKGQYDLGLENHRAALAIYEEINARGQLLDALHDLGRLHLDLGDPVSAERYFQRAIKLARELGLAQAVTVNLLAVGDVRFRREQYEEADALYRNALQRATDAGELNYQAVSLLRLAAVHRAQERFSEADREARRALAVAEDIKAGFTIAEGWFALAETAHLQSEARSALDHYDSALKTSGDQGDQDLRWRIHYGKAMSLIDLGRRHEAIGELQAAARIIEGVRERLREERFKAGYIQDKYMVYVELVRLQLELGLTREAFSTAERLRARSFLEQLERNGPLTRDEADRQREVALRERVRQLQKALAEEAEVPLPERRQLALNTFSSELLIAEREYQAFIDDVQARVSVAQAATVPPTADIQGRLRPGEALVEYVVGDANVMIFVMRPDKLSAFVEALPAANLLAKVNLVRELIQDPGNDNWWAPAESLAASLVRPLQRDDLLVGIDHLYLVPHGILNYLPFALLPLDEGGGAQVVMERYTLTYLPAAATLVSEAQDSSPAGPLLAMAPARARLRYALEEARSISEFYAPASHLLSGTEATESVFKAHAGNYGVLHLSTHGYFNVSNPMLSGLELEPDEVNDGQLEVHEILGLTLDAGLVTLSACETGLGSGHFNEIPAGDDFVSLTRAFLLAGSRSVLATLWEVDDRSTVELMEGFYMRLNQAERSVNKADALAQVQRKLKLSDSYSHPFYWAPFVLVGQHGEGSAQS